MKDDDFGGDYPGTRTSSVHTGDKRPFGDLDEEEDDVFGPKKGKLKSEESGPGATTGMILSLRESLESSKDDLAKCQSDLEAAKSEIHNWHSAFQDVPSIPPGTSLEPGSVVNFLQSLISAENSRKEQLEKAKKKEAAFIVTFAKREQEISDLKSAVRALKTQLRPPSVQTRRLLLDPAIHEEFTRLKEENEEIGAMASEGKIHELGMKIAVLKSQNTELRTQFDGLYGHMEGLTNHVEKANEMVYVLREKLEGKESELRKLKQLLSQKEEEEEEEEEEEREAEEEAVEGEGASTEDTLAADEEGKPVEAEA